MTDDLNLLVNNFKKIANKRWIKGISKSFGSIGLTFEKELDKKPDALYFPDYYGTEIKCTSRYSRYPLFLFTVAFDGPTFPEINRIIDKYGYYTKNSPNQKELFEELSFKFIRRIKNKYKFKLEIDSNEEKLYLCVYDLFNNLIEKKSFVYLNSIKHHLYLKLNKLAIVKASTKLIDNEKYFRYYSIDIYNLISYEKFIELLESDIINVSLIARIGKSGNDENKYRNKNLVFKIKKEKIEKLFTKIYSYNNDLENSYYNESDFYILNID